MSNSETLDKTQMYNFGGNYFFRVSDIVDYIDRMTEEIKKSLREALVAEIVASNNFTPEKIIYNDPATVVTWKDGTKTIVQRAIEHGEKFDKEFGFMAALVLKLFGTRNKFLKIVEEGEFQTKRQVLEYTLTDGKFTDGTSGVSLEEVLDAFSKGDASVSVQEVEETLEDGSKQKVSKYTVYK